MIRARVCLRRIKHLAHAILRQIAFSYSLNGALHPLGRGEVTALHETRPCDPRTFALCASRPSRGHAVVGRRHYVPRPAYNLEGLDTVDVEAYSLCLRRRYPLPCARRLNAFMGTLGSSSRRALATPATGSVGASNRPTCTSTDA
jgi:hypothetical protein